MAPWVIIVFVEGAGIYSIWLLATGQFHLRPTPQSPPSIGHSICGLLVVFAPVVALTAVFSAIALMSRSCLFVKKAIEEGYEGNFEKATMLLKSGYLFPLAKCEEIVWILRQLCSNRKRKPDGMTSEFVASIVLDEWGDYGLSMEGKNKMIKRINSGWFTAAKAEALASPNTIRILMRLVLVVAIIRGIALVIHLFIRH